MKRLLSLGSAAGLLALSPLAISLATFISVPIILGTLGADIWVSITIGQAIGEICRALIVWGWNAVGLTIVAPMNAKDRTAYYIASILPRLLVALPVIAVGVTIAMLIPSVDPSAAVRMTIAGAIYGLTGGWLFIAGDEPLKFVLMDALPRAASILIAAVLLLWIPDASIYGWVNIAGTVIAVSLPFIVANRRAVGFGISRSWGSLRAAFRALRRGLPIVGSNLAMVLRISLPVLITPYIAPAAMTRVSLGDKFFRWANTASTPIMQALLVRIPRGEASLERKAKRGLLIAWIGGLFIGACTTLVSTFLSPILSHGQIHLEWYVALPIGIASMMVFVAAIGGNSVLVMFGRMNQVLSAGIVALVVLIGVILVLAPHFGAAGVFWAFAASESVVVIYQSVIIAIELHSRKKAVQL